MNAHEPTTLSGEGEFHAEELLTLALKDQGVRTVFGVPGWPIHSAARRMQGAGIRFIATRHEQTAGFAAQASSYLSGEVGVCLSVSGPGMTNMVTALGNAYENQWPMVLLSGAANQAMRHRGDFQEWRQLEAAGVYCKSVERIAHADEIPLALARAMRVAASGRMGPAYVELPADVMSEDGRPYRRIPQEAPLPRHGTVADAEIASVIDAMRKAERPLLVVGKGAAMAHAEDQLRALVEATGIPFLPTPMGSGVIPDDHPQSVAAARSFALEHADFVLVVGARLNWMLHFGAPPRFAPDARIAQVTHVPEDIGHPARVTMPLIGDAAAVCGQLVDACTAEPWALPSDGGWWSALRESVAENVARLTPYLDDPSALMSHYRTMKVIEDNLPEDSLLVVEGAATMDVSRQVLTSRRPRRRLDAGTGGTMGLGAGFAIAGALSSSPGTKTILVQGDSAFGFGAMEAEVMVRHGLDVVWIVLTNNGIGGSTWHRDSGEWPPPHAFVPEVRHDLIMQGCGGTGMRAEDPAQLERCLKSALATPGPALIDVPIDPKSTKLSRKNFWLAGPGGAAQAEA